MSSMAFKVSAKDLCPGDTTISHGVPSTTTPSVTPIKHRVQEFKKQTEKGRTVSHQSRNEDHPIHEPEEPSHPKSTPSNVLVSPSITPPSAYPRLHQSQSPTSPTPAYPNGNLPTNYQREAYTPPNRCGVPPISPASISPATSFLNVTSTVEYLLQSAATDSSPESSPEPPSPPQHPRSLTRFETSLSDLALNDAEEDAINGLFCLRTQYGKHPALHLPFPTPTQTSYVTVSATNALSTLPLEHRAKLSCCVSLLTLRKECMREEERVYRRLLIQRGLTGDEDLYEDYDTVVDDDDELITPAYHHHDDMDCGSEGTMKSEVLGVDATRFPSGNDNNNNATSHLHLHRHPVQSTTTRNPQPSTITKKKPQTSLKTARKHLTIKSQKPIPAPSPTLIHANTRVLGYRREKGRKRAGTAPKIQVLQTTRVMIKEHITPPTPPHTAVLGPHVTTTTPALTLTVSRAGRKVRPSRRTSRDQ
ncbi:MAG: hypothetical protein M1830_009631 [Pleopsidium flavum]|nr:MAG: hypothetical protein M1830_009631 [Pleopsidium flavum]